jgi:hypothetical protein
MPTPNYEAIRQMFQAAAPEAPNTDPTEPWLIGLLGSMLGAEQRPGERLGAMFARMAGAGAQTGLRAHEQRRQREDLGRRDRQQHALRLAELESTIGEREYNRAFQEWRARSEDAYRSGSLANQADAAQMRRMLLALQMQNAGAANTPEVLATTIAREIAHGRPVAGLPVEQIRQEAWRRLRAQPNRERLASAIETGIMSNPVLSQEFQALVGTATMDWLQQLSRTNPEEFRRLLSSLRGLREGRPRAGSTPLDLGLD